MFRHVIALLLVVAPLFKGGDARASGAATSTQIMVFNLTPAGSYQVRRNGASSGASVASPSGILVYEAGVNSGDRIEFLLTGLDPINPARPTALLASGTREGCVALSWAPPSPLDYVTDYSLLWGSRAGAYTDSMRIDGIDIAKGAAWVSTRCGFASGQYFFALRAHNAFDRWSLLSVASATTVGNENTQGPVPPTALKATESSFGCASLTWTASSDASVTGYRVFFGSRPRTQAAYTDSIEAGSVAHANRCGLAEGNYYFSVRAYTATGVMSAWSKEASLAMRGVDTAPPSIAQRIPAPGATQVALNAPLFFLVTDDKAGVDTESITVTVNGAAQNIVTSPTVGGIAVQCIPAHDYSSNADVEIGLSVEDGASPPNVVTRTYTFHTGTSALTDSQTPQIAAVYPASGAEGVEERPVIDVRVRDAGLGVDLSSLVMKVNGEVVSFTLEGTPSDAHVRYRPASGFAPQSTVEVRVEACDVVASPNCDALDLHFDTGAANASTTGRGAIVPDGYWRGDAARELEVRDLPQNWCVRIFDASGATVRRHQNTAEGATWVWNFRNDWGNRVAPALYLVRVSDAKGAVQRSGRFLVQSAQ